VAKTCTRVRTDKVALKTVISNVRVSECNRMLKYNILLWTQVISAGTGERKGETIES
jgi:hypothetical protein